MFVWLFLPALFVIIFFSSIKNFYCLIIPQKFFLYKPNASLKIPFSSSFNSFSEADWRDWIFRTFSNLPAEEAWRESRYLNSITAFQTLPQIFLATHY